MRFSATLITVRDIDRAKRFYLDIMEQELLFDFGENIAFESGLSLHQLDHFRSLLDLHVPILSHSNNMELYFETEDIQMFRQKLISDGTVTLIHDLRCQPWQQCVIRFYDPDGHIIEVGESMESVVLNLFEQGYELKQIAEKTQHPISFVHNTIFGEDQTI